MLDKQEVVIYTQKLIKEGYINPYNVDDLGNNLDKTLKYLKWFHKKISIINKLNKRNENDNFWHTLGKIAYSANNFNDIKMIYFSNNKA